MLSSLRIRRFCLVLALGVAVLAAGCGRKGALFLPPPEGDRPPEQTSAPPNK